MQCVSDIKTFMTVVKDFWAEKLSQNKVTVKCFSPDHQTYETPMMLLDISEFSPGNYKGDERLALELDISAICMVSNADSDSIFAVKDFAAKVIHLLRYQNFDLENVRFPEEINTQVVDFSSAAQGYAVWVVNWKQTLLLGENIWSYEGTTPNEINSVMNPGEAGYEHL